MRSLAFAALAFTVACTAPDTTHVLDLPGPRNDAFRAAAARHDLPEDWLVAIAYQQGRFEAANVVDPPDPADLPALDPSDTLADDTPADPPDPGELSGEDPSPGEAGASWGIMYLSDDQIAAAAQLTGRAPDELRTDLAANLDGAAALLARSAAHTDLRTATSELLGTTDDPTVAAVALWQLDTAIANGFDVTTDDGERIAMQGTGEDVPALPEAADPENLEGATGVPDAIARVAPGHYPHVQWIPSPNHSSRLGAHIHYVIIHDMEGYQHTAIQIFRNAANQVSAHYLLRASDGHIVKMVRETQDAWHCGHGWFNRHSIGIEHEGFAFRKRGGGLYTDTQYASSARLVCAIAHRYGIPVDRKHIFGHMNVPADLASHTICSDRRALTGACGGVDHHQDPGRYWDWHKYMHEIATCVAAAQ